MLARYFFIFAAAAMLFAIGWALSSANFSQSISAIASTPWGIVTLLDLYLGYTIISTLIVAVEGFNKRALIWITLLLFTGNIAACLWMVFRGYKFVEMMRLLAQKN